MVKVIIDFSQIMFKTYFIKRAQNMQVDWDFWRYLILNNIQKLIRDFQAHEVILALDSKSWRKDYFKYYKANRDHSKESLDGLFDECNSFIKELEAFFPYKTIRVFGAEADDVLAVLTLFKKPEDLYVLVSNDKDFIQLLSQKKVLLYDLSNEEFIADKIPFIVKKEEYNSIQDYIHSLIISGDVGDNVPSVMRDIYFTDKFINYISNNTEFKEFLNEM